MGVLTPEGTYSKLLGSIAFCGNGSPGLATPSIRIDFFGNGNFVEEHLLFSVVHSS